jgi:hypothetical protein
MRSNPRQFKGLFLSTLVLLGGTLSCFAGENLKVELTAAKCIGRDDCSRTVSIFDGQAVESDSIVELSIAVAQSAYICVLREGPDKILRLVSPQNALSTTIPPQKPISFIDKLHHIGPNPALEKHSYIVIASIVEPRRLQDLLSKHLTFSDNFDMITSSRAINREISSLRLTASSRQVEKPTIVAGKLRTQGQSPPDQTMVATSDLFIRSYSIGIVRKSE